MISEVFLVFSIMLHPLADDDVLEPSVVNELDHALRRSPGDAVYIPRSLVAQALEELGVSKGMSSSEAAIRIISSQNRHGRWIDKSGRDISSAAIAMLKDLSPDKNLIGERIIPMSAIENFSKEKNLPFSEAAAHFRKAGFRKVELSYPIGNRQIEELKKHSFSMPFLVWRCTGRKFPGKERFEDVLRIAEKCDVGGIYLILEKSVEIGQKQNALLLEMSSLAAKNGVKIEKICVQR